MTMTIKSFKEHAQVNELAPLALVPAAVGLAVRAAPAIARSAVSNADKVGAAATVAHSAVKKGYKAVKKFVKREETNIDEKMDPKDHVGPSKKNPDMYCVFDKDGKEHKLFKDKKDAEAYAVKNHDELMGESLWANMHARRKAGKPKKKPGDKGYPKTLDIEAKEDFDGVKNAVKRAYTNISNRGIHYSKGRIKTYNRNPKPAGTPSTASKYSPAKGTSRAEGYSSFAQQKAVWANRADGGKGHPDNKKKSKKEGVDEISRDDMVKKVSSTIGANVPTMLTKHDDEKKKVKTGLDRLRKALGPKHVMNQRA